MTHSGLATIIRWHRQFYHVAWNVAENRASVQVTPDNPELVAVVRRSIEQDKLKQLAVYKGFGYDYLMGDPKQGE